MGPWICIEVRFSALPIALFGLLLAVPTVVAQTVQTRAAEPLVRLVYLVPSDQLPSSDYLDATEDAIQNLQIWYQSQLANGKTFSLSKPIVEVYHTNHIATWYATNPVGSDQSLWFWFNALADGFDVSGGMFFDPDNRWVFYIDADPGCGQAVGAGGGVALLPANDLRGLVGAGNVPPCVGEPPDLRGECRWIGGLGHELGHTFGLPHPTPCPGGTTDNSLMCLGYGIYPNTYFLQDDKNTLNISDFFSVTHNLNTNRMKHFGCGIQ